jgi:hypothetical protein
MAKHVKVPPKKAQAMSAKLSRRLEEWAAQQPDRPDRDEAVRRVIKAIMEATDLRYATGSREQETEE